MSKLSLLFAMQIVAGSLVILLPGCIPYVPEHAYYTSPLNGNNESYHPLPLRTDSAHTAIYANGSFFSGSANELGNDHFTGGRLSLTAAHHFGLFQFFYGLEGTLGSYHLGTWDSGYAGTFPRFPVAAPYNAAALNHYAGPLTFGSAGLHMGVNGVIPVRLGEWRFLGLESSLSREFGDYLSFRKNLPDSAATLNIRTSFFGTLGLTSEIVGRTSKGEFGFRIAGGWVLGAAYHNLHIYDDVSNRYLYYSYITGSFHYTYGQYTGFLQADGGEKGSSIQIGLQYRLNKPRLPAKEWLHR